MSVREREWINGRGKRNRAIVVDYADADGKRRLKTFKDRRAAERFNAMQGRRDVTLDLRATARRIREVSDKMRALADELMKLGSE